MVEKVRPLKRAVCDIKQSAREAERSACGAKGSHVHEPDEKKSAGFLDNKIGPCVRGSWSAY